MLYSPLSIGRWARQQGALPSGEEPVVLKRIYDLDAIKRTVVLWLAYMAVLWAVFAIGLWETTAYALVCAATLTKSLYIADSFPAKRWVETKALKDLTFSRAEQVLGLAGILCLVGAALAEAF